MARKGGNPACVGKKGRSGRKSVKEEIIIKAKEKYLDDYIKELLPDKLLAKKHRELLDATDIGHMVFPTAMTDENIKQLLKTVNCTAKKIQHGDTANHVWFWARNNKALKDGLDMAYKLKGSYAPEKKDINFKDKSKDDLAKEIVDEVAELLK